MSTYVMSDLHGCFDQFQEMLEQIEFSDHDTLILAGDYIDRGEQNIEMMEYLMQEPKNVICLLGNHDHEFCNYINLMLMKNERLGKDMDSNKDTQSLYEVCQYNGSFDYYDTIRKLICYYGFTLRDLIEWRNFFKTLPFMHSVMINGREHIIAHAGYHDPKDEYQWRYSNLKDFCIYSREQGWMHGGKDHATVVFGHTPTLIQEYETYHHAGKIKHLVREAQDREFYDIDCGCVFSKYEKNAKLACLRLEDKEEFYV